MKPGKRKFGTPTDNTPGKPDKKSVRLHEHSKLSSRKTLFVGTETTVSTLHTCIFHSFYLLYEYIYVYLLPNNANIV